MGERVGGGGHVGDLGADEAEEEKQKRAHELAQHAHDVVLHPQRQLADSGQPSRVDERGVARRHSRRDDEVVGWRIDVHGEGCNGIDRSLNDCLIGADR